MALVTSLLIGAGTNIVGSILGHKASKKASEQQQTSGREALALQQQMYERSREDLNPYRVQGGQGLTALTALLGLPAAPSGGGAAPMPTATPAAAPAMARGPNAAPIGPGGLTPAAAWQRARMPGSGGSAQSFYNTPPGAAPTLGPGRGGGMVLLKAPTGQTQQVPADQVDYYLSRGATRG